MRKIVNIIFACICSAALFSCGKEPVMNMDGKLVLTINTLDESVDTKAFPDSEDAIFENQIDRIDYFIYANGNEATPALAGHLDTDAWHEKTFIVDLAGTEFDALFVTGNPIIYAVVNLPTTVSIPSTVSLDALKNTVVSADFKSTASQKTLVMSGEKEIISSGTGATCNIEVARIAAKVTFDIVADEWCYEDSEDVTSDKWYSHPEAMIVNFHNLSSKAYVDGEIGSIPSSSFSYDENHPNRPFYYTYPLEWEYGSTDEPYLFITMPVTRGSFDSSERREAYYKIIFSNTTFESNNWYKYSIRLKMVGSFEREIPVVPTPEDAVFFVYKWGGVHGYNGSATEGQITGFRYLEVEDNSPTKIYYMYNQNVLDIPFKSSDNCVIINKTATSPNFNGTTPFNRAGDMSVTITGTEIHISHTLNNDTSSGKGYSSTNTSGYDYAPITLSFDIQHYTDDHATDLKYTEHINVVQYPAMYIESFVNTIYETGVDTGYGGMYVNGTHGRAVFGNTNGLTQNPGNTNKQMYVIHSSVLSGDDVLGDPRVRTVDNMSNFENGTWSTSYPKRHYYGPGIEGSANRTMEHYYPTNPDASTKNMIAPVFRNASSYGVTNTMTWEVAQTRCATYQEDGYPMGRWRLPTKAEIEYINKLSYDGVFQKLYSDNSEYWCAHGICENGVVTEVKTGSAHVRCIYDEWYWSNTDYPRIPVAQRNTPMWGDAVINY